MEHLSVANSPLLLDWDSLAPISAAKIRADPRPP
jgi:hypothetical protein